MRIFKEEEQYCIIDGTNNFLTHFLGHPTQEPTLLRSGADYE